MQEAGLATQGVVSRSAIEARGVSRSSLSRAVAAGRVVRLGRGTYALSQLPPLPRWLVTDDGVAPEYAAHVRAVLTSLGPTAVACGRTAAVLRGWPLLVEPRRTVEVAVPHARGHAGGRDVRVTRTRSPRADLVRVPGGTVGIAVTPADRTVLDCALSLPHLQAVVVADSALRAGALTVDDLITATTTLRGRDADRARAVVARCDPLAGSVLESVQRVRMVLAGITAFESQVVVRTSPVLRVDFCFRAHRLVVEVDGARWHPDPARDRTRDNALAALGWRVLRYSWSQVVHDGAAVIAEIQAALGSGRSGTHLPARAVPTAA